MSEVTHYVVASTIGRETHSRLKYHRAVFADGTFHAECGADDRMEQPVLVRSSDIETAKSPNWPTPTYALTPCDKCEWGEDDG